MATYTIKKRIGWDGQISEKMASVCRMFGLSSHRLRQKQSRYSCHLQIHPGDIIYITGPSGCGKSVLLAELEKAVGADTSINLAQIELPSDKAVIDCLDGTVLQGLRMLSIAGLGDAFCILNKAAYLSEGEQYRLRLALALSAGKKFIFADEFCNGLDRITASVISWRIRKYAKKSQTTFILASAHQDVLIDLQPDCLVMPDASGKTTVQYKYLRRQK